MHSNFKYSSEQRYQVSKESQQLADQSYNRAIMFFSQLVEHCFFVEGLPCLEGLVHAEAKRKRVP
jgi:hypothetical protein